MTSETRAYVRSVAEQIEDVYGDVEVEQPSAPVLKITTEGTMEEAHQFARDFGFAVNNVYADDDHVTVTMRLGR